jgi:DTW domain-containing protein YfiP
VPLYPLCENSLFIAASSMTDNAVLRLRNERLARATRPFLARGNRIRRCQRCLLPLKQCLCATLQPHPARSRFCLMMYDTEPMKPSNTGRLIADVLPDTLAFRWSRTVPPDELLTLLARGDYQPLVVFPSSYTAEERKVVSAPETDGKPPLFIMLDGTWTEARKMFRKSPWLDSLPVISVNLAHLSDYRLRAAQASDWYCTAEVASALLALAGDNIAAQALHAHFTLFRERYLAGKPHHRGNITTAETKSI